MKMMRGVCRSVAVSVLLTGAALPAVAQQAGGIPFGTGTEHDPSQPVEITSDSLSVDQGASTALFRGSVVVGQGELRLAAEEVEVLYGEGGGGPRSTVEQIRASGGVTVTNGAEVAESAGAIYRVPEGTIEMAGDVILAQGRNAISGERLVIDLEAGIANIEGRVQAIVVPGTQQ